MVRYRPGLDPVMRRRTELHEAHHAGQCRRDGPWLRNAHIWSAAGLMASEAAAHCAEWPVAREAPGSTIGQFRYAVYQDLTSSYPRIKELDTVSVKRAVLDSCPKLQDNTPPRIRFQALNPEDLPGYTPQTR